MTDEEINRAIAEHLGWNWWAVEKGGWYYRQGGAGYTNRIDEAGRYTEADARKELVRGEPMGVHPIPPPNYSNDLNACAEFEKTIKSDEAMDEYLFRLAYVLQTAIAFNSFSTFARVTAKPRQRAEAFLRTVGKWKGDE